MIAEVGLEIALKYWEVEQTLPQWYRVSCDTSKSDRTEFEGFFAQCWKVYELNNEALLYVEKRGEYAHLHFVVHRQPDVEQLVEALLEVRRDIFEHFPLAFGWVLKQNRGVQKICEQLGMEYHGFSMLDGVYRGKVLEWRCYSVARSEFFVTIDSQSLLSLK